MAGSDINKSAIVEKDGMDKLMKLATRFSDDPTVLQEVIPLDITYISPNHCSLVSSGDWIERSPSAYLFTHGKENLPPIGYDDQESPMKKHTHIYYIYSSFVSLFL